MGANSRARCSCFSATAAEPFATRACTLAEQALRTVPGLRGFVGVDLVLQNSVDDQAGSQDVVIELNPRMTMSYIGLRALCRQNLASLLFDINQFL